MPTLTGWNARAMDAVLAERGRQDAKWGVQDHHPAIWLAILSEEVGEAARAILEGGETRDGLRDELVQVAAVAVAWIECMDRAALAETPEETR